MPETEQHDAGEVRPAVLDAHDVTVRYGGVVANNGVSVRLRAGEIVGLIGPNGAGKTTFVDALTGFAPARGSITVGGRRIDGLSAHRRRRAGLARTWQSGELFDDLTVAQNVMVAARGLTLSTMARDLFRRKPIHDGSVERALALVGLAAVADRRPSEISLGQQKMAGVARALVGDTSVLLLDEPAAGLDTHESTAFGEQVCEIARTGIGVLLIDHDMALVLDTCDRVYVIDFGTVIAAGPPSTIREDRAVVEAYLGSPEGLGEADG
ncbi:MAG: ABC transporter ATP-binding protein [Ilumatobacteraceae bacterium]